jgi:hypothetical protein
MGTPRRYVVKLRRVQVQEVTFVLEGDSQPTLVEIAKGYAWPSKWVDSEFGSAGVTSEPVEIRETDQPVPPPRPEQVGIHLSLAAMDPPRDSPPRRWRCNGCGMVGLYDEVHATPCTAAMPPPCEHCGQTPLCAQDCSGIAAALGLPGVVVVDDNKMN